MVAAGRARLAALICGFDLRLRHRLSLIMRLGLALNEVNLGFHVVRAR